MGYYSYCGCDVDMQFPMQVTQAIVIRDNNGNLVISIGPTADIWVYGQTNAIHMTPRSAISSIPVNNDAAIEFYRSTNYIADLNFPPSAIVGRRVSGTNLGNTIDMTSGHNTGQSYSVMTCYEDGFHVSTYPTGGAAVMELSSSLINYNLGYGVEVRPYIHTQFNWSSSGLVLLNGWTNVGPPYSNVQFRIMADGCTKIRGSIQGGVKVDGTALFNIPLLEARPKYSKQLPVRTEASGNQSFVLIIGGGFGLPNAGDVLIYNMPVGNVITLDNIDFPSLADQT